jgi:hypothetical protein
MIWSKFCTLALSSLAAAHMQMSDPPPLRSRFNKHTTDQDYDMNAPMSSSGSNFPCRGHLSVLNTPQGEPVADWVPGNQYSMTITGNAPHGGGSCQASLSLDSGKTWKVIHSYIGNCPKRGSSSYDFTLPSDTPSGKTIFAWSWLNQIGNREMYMNCAVINVRGGRTSKRATSSTPIGKLPDMFVANVGNGCRTTEGTDVMFPFAGEDSDVSSKKTAPPSGNCPSGSGSGNSPAPPMPDTPTNTSRPKGKNISPSTVLGPLPTGSTREDEPPEDYESTDYDEPAEEDESTGEKKPFPSPNPKSQPPSGRTPGTIQVATPPSDNKNNEINKNNENDNNNNNNENNNNNNECQPGAYSCTSDSRGWQICDVAGKFLVCFLSSSFFFCF